MKFFPAVYCLGLLLTLISCRDYSNRVYYYGEEIPVKPFVIKVTKAEYQYDGNMCRLKVFVEAQHKSLEKHSLKKNQFSLRVGDREISHDPDVREKLGMESISFAPGEVAIMTLAFTIPKNEISQRIDLIVNRTEKKGTPSYTLVHLKKNQSSLNSTSGNWREVTSPDWN